MMSLIITFGLLGIAVLLVMYGTIAKNRWGVNLDPVYCPRCNSRLPEIRTPQNLRQRFWGGSTCSCGAEVDKWGREIRFSEPQQRPAKMDRAAPARQSKQKLILVTAGTFFCLKVVSDLPQLWRSGPIHSADLLGFSFFGRDRCDFLQRAVLFPVGVLR